MHMHFCSRIIHYLPIWLRGLATKIFNYYSILRHIGPILH